MNKDNIIEVNRNTAMPNVHKFHENNNLCRLKVKGFKNTVNAFLSDDGRHVYMYTRKGVYRTLIYSGSYGGCFFFPVKEKLFGGSLKFKNWEKV
jgi:hypothetical protein|tara:strand:- start:336 stop:617 length:282 start_codon:yes stop_codon:yes gene_type:complete